MNTARDQYLEHLALRRGAGSCWWNAVILTASSPRQADSYRQEIELRKEQGRLPAGVLYLVVPDPRGDRIGSGGATLNALRTLAESVRGSYTGEAWWRRNRVLLIHSGGDSRRLPQYSPSGKLFTALPAKPPGAATTIFDETLALSTAWAERMPGGLLIGSGDVLLTFDASAVDFGRAGVTGVAMRQPLEVGSQHGVYVTDGHDRVYAFLQKPSAAEIRAAGGLLENDQVAVDTGLLRFHPEIAAALTDIALQIPSIPALDLYQHMTMALTGQWKPSRQDGLFLGAIAATLDGVPFSCCLVDGGFVHLGTTRAFRAALTAGEPGVQPAPSSGGETALSSGQAVVIDSVISPDVALAPGAVLIECHLEHPMRIGRGAMLHGVTGVEDYIEVPEDVVLHQIPVLTPDGHSGVVFRVYGVEDDPKQPVESPGATWFGRPVSDTLAALGLDPERVWANVPAGERSLWNASLFPMLPVDQAWQAAKWMLNLPSTFTLDDWRRSSPMSLAVSAQWADGEMLAEWRRRRMQGSWCAVAFSLAQCGADIRPILANAPGVAAIAGAARALRCEAARLEQGESVEASLGEPLTEAASRHVQASMFFARAGLAREAAQSEEHAFHAVRHAVEAGIAPSSASFAGEREWQFATVTVAAPPRIDLGGGWSDTPPFCLDWGGTVLNIALELDGRYPIQARVTRLAEPVFRCLADGAGTAEFGSMNEVLTTCPPGSPFAVPRAALQLSGIVRAGESLRAALQRRGGGLEVRTSVDLPMGSGLGTSSILAAAVVAALAKMAGTDLTGYGLSDVVTRLEQTMTTGGGWQDQAGGIFPGAKLIHSGPGLKQRLRVHPIGWTPDREREFCQRLVLFDTGIQRIAKNLLRQVVGSYLARETSTVQVLHSIKTLALEMAEAMQEGNWDYLGRLMDRHWRLNQILDSHTTNAPINRLLQNARPYLAGAKLAGAGGGGFMILLASGPGAALELRRRLAGWEPTGRVYDFRICEEGLRVSTAP